MRQALNQWIKKNAPKLKKWALEPAPGGVLTKGGATGAGAAGGGLAALLMSGGADEELAPETAPQAMPEFGQDPDEYEIVLRKIRAMNE